MRGSFIDVPSDEPYPGVMRTVLTSERATVANYAFEAGARFPRHRHAEEQITIVLEGEVHCTVDGETARLQAGEWSVFAPDVEHGMRAGGQGARLLAIVVPARASADAYTVVEES